ncbi:MAG: chemotaxis protein CheA [Sulfurimonas sp.]|jgi:two-component system chemotaxis sensor kinase CheA
MTKEEIRSIFIEEATEIIEKLDIDIINYEEDSENKELLNELFRGVHTLKGSANSFGFTRLGGFVHLFEDVLDHYRDSDVSVPAHVIDIFLNAVDVIKETLWLEVSGDEGVPPNYDSTLESIKMLLENKEVVHEFVEMANLAEEFGEIDGTPVATERVSQTVEEAAEPEATIETPVASDGKLLYKIVLKLDNDIYHRGYDHGRFFQLLSEKGNILQSRWTLPKIAKIENFDAEVNYWGEVELYLESHESIASIEEVFLFVEPEEFSITLTGNEENAQPPALVETTSLNVQTVTQSEAAPTPQILAIEQQTAQNQKIESIKVESKTTEGEKVEGEKFREAPDAELQRRKDDKRSFVKIDTQKLDELFDSVGEMVITQNFVAENDEIKNLNSPKLTRTIENLSKITRLIQNRVMALRMVPVHDTFDKMKRVARDASRKVDKDIELRIEGEETEVDKTMVDSLSDPLIHIIRNAVDHGIEATAEERIAKGKNPKGRVLLRAYHKAGNIAIEVRDDGRGINKEKVYAKAVERGIIAKDDILSDQQIYGLIMQAGFSTADVISDISGRGVGLDVVRSSIEKLQGKVEIDSKVGEGSVFTILLPLTLAIIDGMIVKSAGDMFIIPTLSVVESFIPAKDIVHTARNKGEFVDLRGEMIPVMRLNEILGINDKRPEIWESTLICVESEDGKYALLIDDLVGRQQVVIKPLGKALAKLEGITGGAVMGNGDIALILNVDALFKIKVN